MKTETAAAEIVKAAEAAGRLGAQDWKLPWVKIATLKGKRGDRGHRLFELGCDRRIAIADNSGSVPELTDDGILWLDGKITITEDRIYFSLVHAVTKTCSTTADEITRENIEIVRGLFRAGRVTVTAEAPSYVADLIVADIKRHTTLEEAAEALSQKTGMPLVDAYDHLEAGGTEEA